MNNQPSILLVGVFDGVHIGHQALIQHARMLAQSADTPTTPIVKVLTFESHPTTLIDPSQAPPAIMDADQKKQALLHAGADEVHFFKLTQDLLNLTPEDFVQKIVSEHQPIAMVEGINFRFGKKRAGDVNLLHTLGQTHNFNTHIIQPVILTLRDKTTAPVSSSLIRWLLQHGRITDANLALSRPTQVKGTIVKGEQRGRTIGFPTANITHLNTLLPADGIYAGTVNINNTPYPAAISIGTKPTFHPEETNRTFEAHILNFDQDIYNQTHNFHLHRYLRDQVRYPHIQQLINQIKRDVATVQHLADTNLLDPTHNIANPQPLPTTEIAQ